MAIHLTPAGWRALLVIGSVVVGSAAVVYGIRSDYVPHSFHYDPTKPLVMIVPSHSALQVVPEAMPTAPVSVSVPKVIQPVKEAPIVRAPIIEPPLPDDGLWHPQHSCQNAHFHSDGKAIIGDNLFGEAGLVTHTNVDSGIWIGVTIHANQDHQFDHRIAIHAGKELGWGYRTQRINGEGGYVVRICRPEPLADFSVELWDGATEVAFRHIRLDANSSIHATIGFAVSGLVVGRITGARGKSTDFIFSPVTYKSRGPYLALSGVSTGDNQVVFDDVRLILTPASEHFRDSAVLDARDKELRSRN